MAAAVPLSLLDGSSLHQSAELDLARASLPLMRSQEKRARCASSEVVNDEVLMLFSASYRRAPPILLQGGMLLNSPAEWAFRAGASLAGLTSI